MNNNIIIKLFDWAYAKALSGMGGMDSAIELGNSFLKEKGSLDQQVNSLINWQVAKAGTSGFITGFGGLATMPFTLPANIASVIYIQIRMISAIAYMGGYNLKDDKIKTLVYICMAGNGAKEFLKNIGIKMTERLTTQLITNISAKTILYVNQKVGYRILAKLSEKSVSNLGKIIPIVGGAVGAGIDAGSTRIIGKVAKRIFINNK